MVTWRQRQNREDLDNLVKTWRHLEDAASVALVEDELLLEQRVESSPSGRSLRLGQALLAGHEVHFHPRSWGGRGLERESTSGIEKSNLAEALIQVCSGDREHEWPRQNSLVFVTHELVLPQPRDCLSYHTKTTGCRRELASRELAFPPTGQDQGLCGRWAL